MSESSLVTYTKLSPNVNHPRNHKIDRLSIHCFVGQVTAKSGCNAARFVKYDPVNGASCQYVVGVDGSIGQAAKEEDRSWCTSSGSNDHRAITIEVASETVHPYKVSDAAYKALLDLVTDICKRNGIKKLLWFGDKTKSLNYVPADGEMVMTVHRWFANKSCPGDYLYSKHPEIAEEINRRLNKKEEEDDVTRYKYLDDITNKHYRPVIEILMNAGIITGYGADETGKNVINLSEDMVRTIVLTYRGGAFDKKLVDAGFEPAVK